MLETKIIFVLISGLIVFALLFAGILFFILQFRKTRMMHMEELMKTKLEIQDETLTYIGRELHDNLGQLLTVSKIHVNSLMKQYCDEKKIATLENVLDKMMVELKGLSKSLNSSRIKDFGLTRELANEVERIEKIQVMQIALRIEGEEKKMSTDHEIILYRIIQEFLSNSLKYSQAREVSILLRYHNTELVVEIADNGQGFDMTMTSQGSGVSNIKNRAQLLNAQDIVFTSTPGKGTRLSLTLPIQ